MTHTIFRSSRERPEPVRLRPAALVDGAGAPASGSRTGDLSLSRGPRGGPEQDGLHPAPCPSASLQERWRWRLQDDEDPEHLIAGAQRVHVAGRLGWTLRDLASGEPLQVGPRGRGDAALDPGPVGFLFQPDPEGALRCYDLASGEERFWAGLFMAGGFDRPLVARVGDTLLVQGVEREQPHGAPRGPELSSLEAWPVGERRQVGPTGQLRPGPADPVLFTTPTVVSAAWAEGAVTAEPDRLLWWTPRLEPTALVTGSLQPLSLSLDGAGRAHLLVRDPGVPGGVALWVVEPDGRRCLRVPLPGPLDEATTPPAIGPGGWIVIHGGGRLLTLEPDGRVAWCRPVAPDAPAPVVTADGQVLMSDGVELVAFDPGGQRRVLHRFDRPLVTAPALTAAGQLLVASRDTLHCLA